MAWSDYASHVVRKLFTREDPHFLHKTLGALSLASFMYRYAVVYNQEGHLGFAGGSLFDHLTMLVHFGLSTSSLIFHVLARRIPNRATIIWHEYRLHAIVFTTGCVSVYALGVALPYGQSSGVLDRFYGLLLLPMVLAQSVAADEVTRRHGPEDPIETTVRAQSGKNDWRLRTGMLFYSFYQFAMRAAVLTPHVRAADLGYNALIAIQSSAFLMTLVKKGVVRWQVHAALYTAALLLSLYHIRVAMDDTLFFWTKTFFVFALRTQFGISKYVVWLLFVFASLPDVTGTAHVLLADSLPRRPLATWDGLLGFLLFIALAIVGQLWNRISKKPQLEPFSIAAKAIGRPTSHSAPSVAVPSPMRDMRCRSTAATATTPRSSPAR